MGFSDEFRKEYKESNYVNDSDMQDDSDLKKFFNKEKQEATDNGLPWVKVIDVRIDNNNPRNGFFDLDWNEEFIETLLDNGIVGETQEEMVETWFKAIISEMIKEEGIEYEVNAGNVVNFLKQE